MSLRSPSLQHRREDKFKPRAKPQLGLPNPPSILHPLILLLMVAHYRKDTSRYSRKNPKGLYKPPLPTSYSAKDPPASKFDTHSNPRRLTDLATNDLRQMYNSHLHEDGKQPITLRIFFEGKKEALTTSAPDCKVVECVDADFVVPNPSS